MSGSRFESLERERKGDALPPTPASPSEVRFEDAAPLSAPEELDPPPSDTVKRFEAGAEPRSSCDQEAAPPPPLPRFEGGPASKLPEAIESPRSPEIDRARFAANVEPWGGTARGQPGVGLLCCLECRYVNHVEKALCSACGADLHTAQQRAFNEALRAAGGIRPQRTEARHPPRASAVGRAASRLATLTERWVAAWIARLLVIALVIAVTAYYLWLMIYLGLWIGQLVLPQEHWLYQAMVGIALMAAGLWIVSRADRGVTPGARRP